MLALSRHNLPALPRGAGENLSAKGAYVLIEPEGGRDVTFIATGSELEIALAAAKLVASQGLRAAVVSMPCWELFEAQSPHYRAAVLGTAPRVGIEAAARLGWDRWLGDASAFIGMKGFGASAPAADLYDHFGITVDAAAAAAITLAKGGPDA